MTDPVKAHLVRVRDLLADLTDANDAAIREHDRRDDVQLDLEQTDPAAYHAAIRSLRIERDAG